ncbi:MAG: biotin--[Ruminococcus sp.]|nr:biotin--[acetyl-CoA-carboxylase] ligase [Ruminococcus sp.]
MKLNQKNIEKNIKKPVTVRLYDSIDSTNNEAKRRADIDKGMHLYAAGRQTAGRGRHGNRFYSPKDTGLYMTLSLPLDDSRTQVQQITCAAAVAVCEAINELSDLHPQIKWVNDIFVGGKKAGGILTELISDDQNRPTAVIIGIGLNLNTEDFPAEIADKAGNLGSIDIDLLCAAIVNNLITEQDNLSNNSIIEKYKSLNLCIGRDVRFTKDGAEHTAKAVDVNADGGLVVKENGEFTVLNSGEISVLPQ